MWYKVPAEPALSVSYAARTASYTTNVSAIDVGYAVAIDHGLVVRIRHPEGVNVRSNAIVMVGGERMITKGSLLFVFPR